MTFPTDNNVIPDADPDELLSNMHTTLSHTEGTNAIIAKLAAVAAKLGTGADTAAADEVLRGNGAGTTDFGKVLAAYINGGGAGDANTVLQTIGGTTAAWGKVLAAMMAGSGAGDANTVLATVGGTTVALQKVVAGMLGAGAATGAALGSDVVVTGNGAQSIGTGKTLNTPTLTTPSITSPSISGSLGQTQAQITAPTTPSSTYNRLYPMADDRWWNMPDTGNAAPIGAFPAATLVVAASNSSAYMKANADYLCDGTADDVELNAAATALPSGGGKVLLCEGQYSTSATVTTAKANTLFEGMGYNTLIKFTANVSNNSSVLILANHYCQARNLKLDGNKSIQTGTGTALLSIGAAGHCVVENIWGTSGKVYGISVSSGVYGLKASHIRIESCDNLGIICDSAGTYTNTWEYCVSQQNERGFYINGSNNNLLGCLAYSNTLYGFELGGANAIGNQLTGCTSYGGAIGFYISGASYKNILTGCKSNSTSAEGIYLSSTCYANSVIGCDTTNSGTYGIRIGSSAHNNAIVSCRGVGDSYPIYLEGSYNTVQSCAVYLALGHGITITGGGNNSIIGNHVIGSSQASASYHGMMITSSDHNYIDGNKIHKGAVNQALYGIYIASGTNNFIGDNDLYQSGNTGEIYDAGTTTFFKVKSQIADSTAIHTTTSDTAFSVTHAYAANRLHKIGRVVKIKVWGHYANTGAPSIQLKVKFGSTTVLDFGAITATSVTSARRWMIDATITVRAIGASGSVQCEGEARIPTANDNSTHSRPVANSTTTIDTTAAQTLTISATHSVSNAANTITMTQFVAEVLN